MSERKHIADANELHRRILELIYTAPEISVYHTIGVLEAVKADLLDQAKEFKTEDGSPPS